jgi:hypothetical protein
MNHVDNHLITHQKSMAGIVGAMVHELNNPLQGIVSLLALHARESGTQEPGHSRIEQLQAGLNRMVRVIDDFSVIYENLPRHPEMVTVSAFRERLKAQFANRQWTVVDRTAEKDGIMFSCLTPEIIRLVVDAFTIHGEMGEIIHIKFDRENDALQLYCEQGNSEDPELDVWHKLEMNGVLSGLPVLLTEIARLGNGEAEFRFDHMRLRGIRLTFITVL